MKKFLFIAIALSLWPAVTLAQGIPVLDQFTSTTTPSAAITQRTYGKAIKITGLPTGLCLSLDSNSLVTTSACSGGGGGSTFGTTSISALYPLTWNTSTAQLSIVATSSLNLVVGSFLSPNISQWTNNSGYLTSVQPFTIQTWGVSTTSTIGLYNGFVSNASSTINANLLINGNSTTTNATSTNFFTATASTTNLFGTLINGFGLSTCSASNKGLSWSAGLFGCQTYTFASSTLLTDNNAFTGTDTFVTQSASDNSTKVATTAYVTTGIANAIAGVNPAIAVQWATTAAGDTSGLTYANAVSGVGATFTGANNTTTAMDGHTFVVGDVGVTRVLIKNDTQSPSGAFNGIYLFTALHTSITGDVFTRALDYDQSSDINNTGAIPVISGTANQSTSWVETATVNTVGTDPLSFTKFSINPTTIVTSVTGTWPIISSGGTTPNITWGGLATSSALTISRLHYTTGANTFADVATSSPTFSSPLTTSGTAGYIVGGSSFTVGCQTASGSQAGCLSSTDWNTFNGNLRSYDPFTHPSAGISATTSSLLIQNATSTFAGGLTATTATTTNATTTSLTVSATHILLNTSGTTGYITASSSAGFNIASTTLDAMGHSFNVASTTLLLKNFPFAITLKGFYCEASTTGTALVNFSHSNGNKTEVSNCTTGAYLPVATNNTYTAFEDFDVQASSTAGVVNRITITPVWFQTSD